jgi:hypothetical protein
MRAPNENTAAKGMRGWWVTPLQHGIRRLIHPWAYCQLRAFEVRIEALP